MEKESKLYYISYEKELSNTLSLISMIKSSGWIDSNTVIVNCFPEYSSNLVQITNHKLSHLNDNELFPVIDLKIPYPTMSQIWDLNEMKAVGYDNYLYSWARQYLDTETKYLFLSSFIIDGKNYNKIWQATRSRMSECMFATSFLERSSSFTPNFYAEMYDKEINGGLVMAWENLNNPNWDY